MPSAVKVDCSYTLKSVLYQKYFNRILLSHSFTWHHIINFLPLQGCLDPNTLFPPKHVLLNISVAMYSSEFSLFKIIFLFYQRLVLIVMHKFYNYLMLELLLYLFP